MTATRKGLVADIEAMLKTKYPDHTVTAGDRGVTIAKEGTSWTIGVSASNAVIAALKAQRKKK